MSNSYTLDVWQLATHYLQDREPTLSKASFNNILGSIRSRDVLKMLSLKADPLTQSIEEYRTLSQLIAFFSKNSDFSDDTVCTANAITRFNLAETFCKITNKRLKHFAQFPHRDPYASLKALIRVELRELMGNPIRFLDGIPSMIRLTSGSTENSARKNSLPYLKIRSVTSCTPGCIPFVSAFAKYHEVPAKVRTVEANRIVFVEKNAKTHRTIAAEPQGNLPFQLAVDSYMKSRLLKWGIDLSSQQKNQQMALEGSLTGKYATIDLSMASDTLSLEVVRTLLPKKWVEILSRLRCSFYKGATGYGEYQKFSSMGNGYTFPLETAIFTAIIRALGVTDYAVYGDDIAVPTEYASSVIELLRHFGFRTNIEKTFVSGPFRESCGSDYYDGKAVRPFYVRHHVNLPMTDICHIINGLFRVGVYDGKLWKGLRLLLTKLKLPLVPNSEDTRSGIMIDWDSCRSQGLIVERGWISYAKLLSDVSDTLPLRSLYGLKVLIYHQLFEREQSGWVVRFTHGATRIVRFREAPTPTNGPILATRVRKVRRTVTEHRNSLLLHYISLASWLLEK